MRNMHIQEIVHNGLFEDYVTRIYPIGFDTADEYKKYNAVFKWTAKNPCILFFKERSAK